jgi:type II secretory pathway component PulJ
MGILSAISVILASSFVSLTKGGSIAEARAEVNSNARLAVDSISQDLMRAASIASPVAGSASTLIADIGTETVEYAAIAGRLERASTVNGTEILTSDSVTVSGLSFTRIENGNAVLLATTTSIALEVTVEHKDKATPYSATLKTSIDLR